MKEMRAFLAMAGMLALCSFSSTVSAATAIPGQGNWEARLHPRDLTGDGIADAYFDDIRGITWLADANYAKTSGYVDDPNNFVGWHTKDGGLTWAEANAWISQLDIGGVTGWRLPKDLYPDPSCISGYASGIPGHDCSGGELEDMYYDILGNSFTGTYWGNWGFTNSGPFQNIQNNLYWTSTDSPNPDRKIYFAFYDGAYNGMTGDMGLGEHRFAWAVHDGDVGVSTVPLPLAAWLFASGVLGLLPFSRRQA